MYISLAETSSLDTTIKNFEVALRSFVAYGLSKKYSNVEEFRAALLSLNFPKEVIYGQKFDAKVKGIIKNAKSVFDTVSACVTSIDTKKFNNDVPYVSEILDLLFIFFNEIFSQSGVTKKFPTVEEFHYCAVLYHSIRNNLSHPASRPISEEDASKILYFISNLLGTLEDKYFWYAAKSSIKMGIEGYQKFATHTSLKRDNLNFTAPSYKTLLCRDAEIQSLYSAIIGEGDRKRVAGSVVVYGYGGVGKTAITTEFLLRILRDKKDGRHNDIEFILFFSSKDEYLRSSNSTGALYIDKATPQFSTIHELQELIFSELEITNIEEISRFQRGIIVIDNVENVVDDEKIKIHDFIKATPRSVQFILTSRAEEPCEEKIHVGEFTANELGVQFIVNLIGSEDFDIQIDRPMAERILSVSKGNPLIIIQVLSSLSRKVVSFDDVTRSLESLRSSNSESVANFMYKNTFDDVLRDLGGVNVPVKEVIQVISLYEERIELYSISVLTGMEIKSAEKLCDELLKRLVLVKSGEYYELNEFAKRFVFIKLLPDRIELKRLTNKIAVHKKRTTEKLKKLEDAFQKKNKLRNIMGDWQPRNYIDKMVIAETFLLYLEASKFSRIADYIELQRCISEFYVHKTRTNHPYAAFQEARLLKLEIQVSTDKSEEKWEKIGSAYEEALDSIQFDCRYLLNTRAHSSLLMLYGIFLAVERNDPPAAVRYLEDAKKNMDEVKGKIWFTCCVYLAMCYAYEVKNGGGSEYADFLRTLYEEVLTSHQESDRSNINIERFKDTYREFA